MDEKRVLYFLLIIIAALYLWQMTWGFLSIFSDIFLVLILSWLLAFALEPTIKKLTDSRLSRLTATCLVYIALGIIAGILIVVVVPIVISQLAALASAFPSFFENAPDWLKQFTIQTLTKAMAMAQGITSAAFNLFLVFIFSFYFIIDRHRIAQIIYNAVPETWENNLKFLGKVVNTSFAEFLRVQVVLGIIVSLATYIVLIILGINYALTTALIAGLLAIVPVVGPFLSLLPPLLPAAMVSFKTIALTAIILALIQQIIYNIISPRIMGEALKLHPVLILLTFILGFKISGFWGAVFAVPITSAFAIIIKEFLYHQRYD